MQTAIVKSMIKKYILHVVSKAPAQYLAVGGVAFIVEYSIFALLMHLFITPSALIFAQTASFSIGLTLSFFGNKLLTFKDSNKSYKHSSSSQFLKYSSLAGFNLILTNIFLYLLTHELELAPLVAKIVVMAAVITWNFLIFQRFIFKSAD